MTGYYAPRQNGLPVVTTVVCLICAIIFCAIHLNPAGTWGEVSDNQIFQGAWWGLITNAFVHIEILHIAFNLWWFWILGTAMERSLGSIYTVVFLLVSAFVSSGLQLETGTGGIGLSGVVYAVFGFAWVTRRRWPEFAAVATPQNAQLFVGWAFLCVVLTYFHEMNVGNGAHMGGALFGAAIGAAIENKDKIPVRIAAIFGAVLLAGLSVVSLFYCPQSLAWVSSQAVSAQKSGDLTRAISLYKRGVEMDDRPDWAWHDLVEAYMAQGNLAAAQDADDHLKAMDPDDARKLAEGYGLKP